MHVGERCNLWQVRHHDHLGTPGELGEGPTDRGGRSAADPGIDLVEHHRRRPAAQHLVQREHRAGEFASRCRPGDRLRQHSRVRRHAELDLVAGIVRLDPDVDAGRRHGQFAEMVRHRGGQFGRHPAALCADDRRATNLLGGRRCDRAVELNGPCLVGQQVLESFGELGMESHDLGQRVSVLASELDEQVTPQPDDLEPLGVGFDPLGDRTELVDRVGQLRKHVAQAPHDRGVRNVSLHRGRRSSQAVENAPVVGERREGDRTRLEVIECSSEEVLLGGECVVLVGIGDRRTVQFRQLELEEFDLAGSTALVAPEFSPP